MIDAIFRHWPCLVGALQSRGVLSDFAYKRQWMLLHFL